MSILDLLLQDGAAPRKVAGTSGGEWASACPACGGNDRFHVWPKQGPSGRYWCRGCGIKGDAIEYLKVVRGLGYRDACALLGVELNDRGRGAPPLPAWTPKAATIPLEKWREKAAKLVSWAETYLWSPAGAEALEWLRSERFLSDRAIRAARLGWLPKTFYRARSAWGLDEQLNDRGKPKRLWLPGGIVIPLLHGEEVHRVRIRRPDPGDGPRYVVISGSSNAPMVLGENREAFVVVESELDGLLLHQECSDLVGCVALGSASNRPDQRTTELLRGARQVLVALDGDDAGAKQAWKWWPENFNRVRRWPPVGGKDPGDMMKAGVGLGVWIQAAIEPQRVEAAVVEDAEQDWEELELFASVLTSIELSREYSRIFPQVSRYLERELTPEHFKILELARAEGEEHPTPRTADEFPRILFAGGARVCEPCRWMHGFCCTHADGPGVESSDGRGCERFRKEQT